ncbi:MAG: phosphotransferase [Coriobacteriales bacterium]|nr:phosphotransferase [Coriobacteriales bacterium]
MNVQEYDILNVLFLEPYINQRTLAQKTGHSLGIVNRSLKVLINEGYVTETLELTQKAKQESEAKRPKNAIILAAGFGMRMVPINYVVPKALLEVQGELLIERQIKQLHEVGITDITVVVGFMKEKFDYLIDEFGIDLIVNSEYAKKNNLVSLGLVKDRISNTYIVPSDVWCDNNPFNTREFYSWYMVSDLVDNESTVRVNRKNELVPVDEGTGGNAMVGIAYITEEDAKVLRERIGSFIESKGHDDEFWETVLLQGSKWLLPARVVHASHVVEINTFEQLRDIDSASNHLKSSAIDVIARTLSTTPAEVTDISVLKKGMTNRSFLFTVSGEKYIMRIPGEGTELLINRAQEAEVYHTISGKGLCDDPLYIDAETGYKITKYLDGVRTADISSKDDLSRCMQRLRAFHEMDLKVTHSFDLFGQIEFYESLWNGQPSIYRDYAQTKANVLSLKTFVDAQSKAWSLTHIDAIPDNFLFYRHAGEEKLQLTDWEYAGMQDPHVDIAMFCIYSFFDRQHIDELIDLYFDNTCDNATRAKIYCYVSICGLLWSNWCEYKRNLGVEFSEYSLKQYRYAKDYYVIARNEISAKGL